MLINPVKKLQAAILIILKFISLILNKFKLSLIKVISSEINSKSSSKLLLMLFFYAQVAIFSIQMEQMILQMIPSMKMELILIFQIKFAHFKNVKKIQKIIPEKEEISDYLNLQLFLIFKFLSQKTFFFLFYHQKRKKFIFPSKLL